MWNLGAMYSECFMWIAAQLQFFEVLLSGRESADQAMGEGGCRSGSHGQQQWPAFVS